MVITKGLSMKNAPHKKLQSAMEYLMTYGWAILIIAVVIGVLYAMGIFNSSGLLGSFCTAQTGYFCVNPILSTNSPTLNVTIGQDTRLEWPAWKIFAVRGTAFNASSPNITGSGAFYNGEKQIVAIPLNSILGNYIPIGTPFSGSLWAEYCNTPNCNTPDQVSEIGIFYTKAAKLGYVTTSVLTSSISTTSTTSTSTTSTATTAPTTTIVPSGIIYSVPITLTNSQSSNTPAPFQQMVNISESTYSSYLTYNGNSANFEYYILSGNTVSVLPAWIESNNSGKLITWVKLPNGIPAESSITIYLGFASTSSNLLSSSGTTGIGEAPQLPCGSTATSSCSTYAEYDDGASVFNNYWNFAGTTTPNGWVQSGVGIVQNNGVTVSESTGDGTLLTSANTYGLNANSILDFYGSLSTASQNTYTLGAGYMTGPGGISGSSSSDYGVGAGIWGTGTNWYVLSVSGGAQSSIDSGIVPSAKIVSIYWATTSGATISFNYTDPNIITTDIPTTKTQIGIGGNNQETQTMTIQYMRTRAYPPNGVMPIKNFKQMQNITYINTTPNPAPYGQNIAITATCPTGDTCTVQSPLGVTLATGTTTATYKISGGSAEDAPGIYTYYAKDINTSTIALKNITILPQPYTIPGNYIFRVPSGVTSLTITAVAGGAGGGGGAEGYGGGSGWSVVNKSYSVTPYEHIPITVGAAGGSIGGNTIVGNLVTLQGAIGQEGQLFGGYGGAAPSYYYGGNGASADPGYPFGTGGNGDILQVGGGTSYGAGSATGYGSGGGGGGGSGSGGEIIITGYVKGFESCNPTPMLHIYSTPIEYEQNITIKSSIYGQNINITATCPTGDTCTVQSPLGVTLATGTTTATYKISGGSAEDAPGIYTYYAKDINTSTIALKNITILPQPYTIPGNYIFRVPSGVTSLTITAVAGGAGGGGGAEGYGGGSGWSVVNKSYSVTPYEHIPITVGAAGGSIGGNTIVGNLVTLQGAIGQEGQLFGGYGGAAPSYYYGGNGASADPGYPFGTGGNGDILQVGGGTSYGAGSATGYGSGGGGGGGSGSGGEVIITNMSR